MDWDQINHLCPGAKYIGRAYLNNFKVTERQYADIDPCLNNTVYGMLWGVTNDHLISLDKFESCCYERISVEINLLISHNEFHSVTYIMSDYWKNHLNGVKYEPAYIEHCFNASKFLSLPENVYELV